MESGAWGLHVTSNVSLRYSIVVLRLPESGMGVHDNAWKISVHGNERVGDNDRTDELKLRFKVEGQHWSRDNRRMWEEHDDDFLVCEEEKTRK